MLRSKAFGLGVSVILAATAFSQEMPADYDGVLKALGKQGDFKAMCLKVNIPRNDLKVTIDGIADADAVWLRRLGRADKRHGRK